MDKDKVRSMAANPIVKEAAVLLVTIGGMMVLAGLLMRLVGV